LVEIGRLFDEPQRISPRSATRKLVERPDEFGPVFVKDERVNAHREANEDVEEVVSNEEIPSNAAI